MPEISIGQLLEFGNSIAVIIAKDETYVIVFYMKYSCTHMVAIDLYGNLYGRRFKEGIWKYVE